MAEIATLTEPYTVSAPLPGLPGIPVGDLIDAYTVGTPTGIVTTITNRFPTPPAASAFLIDLALEADPEVPLLVFDGLGSPFTIFGALTPAGPYLEPTTGQIWPRRG